MSQQDKDQFNSFAHAQVSVTNQLYQYLNKPNIFIFCPTGFSLIFNKFYLQI
jgi:protein O-GlcNAcase/histone acetyltransferase